MPTTYIVDKDGNQIDASTATVPSDRHFRGAWSLSGKVISEDMAKAKEIFKDKIREVRAPLLDAEDVVYMKALEADDASAKTASVAKKKALRDAPAAQAGMRPRLAIRHWSACNLTSQGLDLKRSSLFGIQI